MKKSIKSLFLPVNLAASSLFAAALAGCSPGLAPQQIVPVLPVQGSPVVQGKVYGGNQPIIGAHVYLLAAGTSGYGGASTSLLTNVPGATTIDTSSGPTNGFYYVTTDTNGNFSLGNASSQDYSCTSGQQVYVYTLGGNPGSGTNSSAAMMAVLGACPAAGNFVASTPFIFVNELSTVAAAYAFSGFASDALHVSTSNTTLAQTDIANAFANAASLVSLSAGTAYATSPNGATVPQKLINTLGNILAYCVNSADSTPTLCSTLFGYALNGSSQPTDTATAAINIAHNPGTNVANLTGLTPASPPFQPAFTGSAPPNDFIIGINYPETAANAVLNPRGVAIDAAGNAWILNQTATGGNLGSVTEFSPSGTVLSTPTTGYTNSTFNVPFSIALDTSGNAWIANSAGSTTTSPLYSVTGLTSAGAQAANVPFTGGGLDAPYSMTVDGNNNIWVVNGGTYSNGANQVSEFSSSGTALSPSNGFTGGGVGSGRAVAIDSNERAWVVSSSVSYGVSLFGTNGSPISSSAGYTGNGFGTSTAFGRSIAIDSYGNAWVPLYTGTGLFEISGQTANLGTVMSPSGGYTGGGLTTPAFGIAIDGSNNAWIANDLGSGNGTVAEFNNAGTPLSPSTGYTGAGLSGVVLPHVIAIDGSGDVWLVNSSSVTEFIGAATPVVTPMSSAVKNSNLGARPDTNSGQTTPTITWATPSAITYGTLLSGTQLNASASVPGTFVYSPASGTLLTAGTQPLTATFTPTDTAHYSTAQKSVSLVVDKALPVINWSTPASIASGTSLSSTQLNATSPVAGTFAYTPASGTTETIQGALTLQTIFTPTDTNDYMMATATNTLTINPPTGTPTYSWTSVTINAGGFTDGLYFHPKQQGLLYAKMDIADAYRYNTSTSSWVSLLDWINRSTGNYFHTDYYGVGALALDPTDPTWLYLGVGMGTGSTPVNGNLLISHDQGNTFTNIALPFDIHANASGREGGERMAVDPNLPSRIYFGTNNDGLWYSDNRGLTWAQNTNFPSLTTTNGQGISFVLPVATSGTTGSLTPMIFAGVAETTTGGTLNTLYVSTNAGASWTPVSGQISGTLLPIRGRLGPNHELYVTYDNAIGPDGITAAMICAYTYTDTGTVGAPRNITPTPPSGSTAGFVDIEPDPNSAGTLLTATIDGTQVVNGHVQDYIYRSVNDGVSWTQLTGDTHNITATPWLTPSAANKEGDWVNLAVDPFDSTHVIYGDGEMIFATNNIPAANTGGSVTWYEQAVGEEEHNVVSLAAPQSGTTILYSGLHDHNGMAHTSLTVSPSRYSGANTNMASSIAYAESNPNIVARVGGDKRYATGTAPFGAYSSNAGSTWTTFANTPLPNTSVGDGAIAVSADGTTLVWAPYDVAPVYSTDQGQTWTLCTGAPSPSKKVVADHVNTNMFYMSSMTYMSYPTTTTGGPLYVSTDEGHTFNPVAGTSSLPAGDVYANFAIAGDVWLTAPYYGLYRNTGTASAIVMTKISTFNNAYHMAFGAPKPGSGYTYTVYVDGNIGGIDGVYRSTDGGTTWQLITDQQHQFGYLNVIEADRRTFGTVYLGPGGRGIIWGTSSN